MTKYRVTCIRAWMVCVQAENKEEAIDSASKCEHEFSEYVTAVEVSDVD